MIRRTTLLRIAGLFGCLLLTTAGLALAAPETYKIDPAHSTIGFAIRHLGINDVRGVFRSLEGTVQRDSRDIARSSVKVTIRSESVDTGVADRDKHLRTPDFLDSAAFPEITFESKSVVQRKDGVHVTGFFTLHGATREVTIICQVTKTIKDPWGNERFGVHGGLVINRLDYGIKWDKLVEGVPMVGHEVKIQLDLEVVKEKDKPQK